MKFEFVNNLVGKVAITKSRNTDSNSNSRLERRPRSYKGIVKIINNSDSVLKVFVIINKVCYTLNVPLEFKPLVVFSTTLNDVYELHTPKMLTKPHLWRSLSDGWEAFYDGMEIKVSSLDTNLKIAEFDTEEFTKSCIIILDKYNTKMYRKSKKEL